MRILILLSLLLSATQLYSQEFEDLIKKREKAYDQERYDEAAAYADSALILDPNNQNSEFLYNAACVFSLVGEKDKALYLLERSLINGYQEDIEDIKWIETDSDLDNIRNTDKYRSILLTHVKDIVIYAADTAFDHGNHEKAIILYDSAFNSGLKISTSLLIRMVTLNAELEFTNSAIKYLEKLFQDGYSDISFVILNSKLESLRETSEVANLISAYSDPNMVYTHTFINDITNPSKNGVIQYEGKTININLTPYLNDSIFLRKYGLSFDDSNYLRFNKSIEIRNCLIDALSLSRSYIRSVEMVNNKARNKTVYISTFKANNLVFDQNTFENLYLVNLDIQENFDLRNHTGQLMIDDCYFNLTDLLYIQGDIPTLTISRTKFNETEIEKWDEETGEEYGNIIVDVRAERLEFNNNIFDCDVILNPSIVSSNVIIQENVFYKYFDLHNAILPDLNKYIPYRQFNNGFAIFTDIPGVEYFTGFNCRYCIKFSGSDEEDFGNLEESDKLIKSLQIMHNHYKQIGDLESAAATLWDINNLYSNRSGYTYKTKGGFQNFIKWKQMQFIQWQNQNETLFMLSGVGILLLLVGGSSIFIVRRKKRKTIPSEKRLAAIVFSDIVDYTTLMGSDEKKTMKILDLNRSVHVTIVNRHNGNLLKEMGDGMLCSFQTASDAVKFCIDVQKENINSDYKLRMGVHLGEVTFSKGDVYGDGVNIASRLESEAKEGGICISGTVYQNIRNQTDIVTEFLGEKELKHVTTKMEVYGVIY
jgi:class 3 adenylate cyclase